MQRRNEVSRSSTQKNDLMLDVDTAKPIRQGGIAARASLSPMFNPPVASILPQEDRMLM
jgi:hypothetical protein